MIFRGWHQQSFLVFPSVSLTRPATALQGQSYRCVSVLLPRAGLTEMRFAASLYPSSLVPAGDNRGRNQYAQLSRSCVDNADKRQRFHSFCEPLDHDLSVCAGGWSRLLGEMAVRGYRKKREAFKNRQGPYGPPTRFPFSIK